MHVILIACMMIDRNDFIYISFSVSQVFQEQKWDTHIDKHFYLAEAFLNIYMFSPLLFCVGLYCTPYIFYIIKWPMQLVFLLYLQLLTLAAIIYTL